MNQPNITDPTAARPGPPARPGPAATPANVKRYNRQLRDLIIAGRAKPSFVVSHELPLEEAPGCGYHRRRR